ncbi:hypothetical protein [Nocardia salmonicida]|uniref:hypothetical protein n=1 Tax=Nocardia salmonicida TaxID=53431 RepID=UPI0033F885CB
MPSDDLLPGHGAGWLDPVDINDRPSDEAVSDHAGPDKLDRPSGRDAQLWARSGRPSRAAIFVISVVAAVSGALVGAGGALVSSVGSPTATTASATTIAPSLTPSPRSKACVGVTAQTVTDGPGDTTTIAGVIAKFESAYYRERNIDAALTLVGPLAGITREGLTAAITALPAGVTHCVGIDVIADNTAHVHLVELHADGRRLDYLQLVNLAWAGSGLVITNVQKRGG